MSLKVKVLVALLACGVVSYLLYEFVVGRQEQALIVQFEGVCSEVLKAKMTPREAVGHIRTRIDEGISIGSELTAIDIEGYTTAELPATLDSATKLTFSRHLPRLNRPWPRAVLATVSFHNGAAYHSSVRSSDERP